MKINDYINITMQDNTCCVCNLFTKCLTVYCKNNTTEIKQLNEDDFSKNEWSKSFMFDFYICINCLNYIINYE